MISQIMKALDKGFTEDQVLDFIVKKFPKFASKIIGAKTAGFNGSQILNTLLGRKQERENASQPTTEYEQTTSQDIASQKSRSDKAQIAGTLAATSLAAPIVGRALQRAIPSSLQSLLPQMTAHTTGQDQQSEQLQTQQPPIDLGNATNITQTNNIKQPEVISNPKEYLEKLGIKDKVDDLLKRGNPPESVVAALSMKRSGESKIDPELLKNVEEYAKLPKEEAKVEEKLLQKSKELEEEQPEIESSIVATPEGFGEVKISRNGKSIVDVNGKKHQVDESKILKPPKEAALEALELIKSFTPEQQRSAHHMLNAYDDSSKQGFFVFHNGSAYVVDDISPEEYKELSEEIEQAKTTGETIIGKWSKGEGSRGAGYNKIVKGVRDRKVVPEFKKNFKKLQVGYNSLAEWQRLLNEK